MSQQTALLEHLLSFVSENKQTKFDQIIAQRTRHITVVLEDLYQPHNASAVLRSCDCFGVQDVHIIENSNVFTPSNNVAQGCAKWLSIHKHNELENNTKACIQSLKKQGYKIYATTPHTNDCSISEIPVDERVALLFGTEMHGLSDIAMEEADAYTVIPMQGFTESFNISVSAAISLYEFTTRLRKSSVNWQLSDAEREEILLNWCQGVVKSSDQIIERFLQDDQP